MLWYKAWLETKWRMLIPLTMVFVSLSILHSKGQLHFGGRGSVLYLMAIFWLMPPLILPGSGIRTEAPWQGRNGIHGSIFFTLSLPVSRLRLFATRTAIALAEAAGIVAGVCCIAALIFPELRRQATLGDGLRYIVTLLLCGMAYFGLSTLLSTFLDQQWQIFIGGGTVWVAFWLSVSFGLPERLDILSAMGPGSPLITHAMPWSAVGLSVSAGIVLLLAAFTVVRTQEY